MKKLYTIIIIFLIAACPLMGQHAGSVITSNASMDRYGDSVCVTFVLKIGRKAVARTNTLVMSPVITDNVNDVTLPPVVVRGGKRAEITDRRHDWAGGGKVMPTVFDGQAVMAQCGEIIRYTVLTDYQPWMENADIVLEAIDMGCCREPVTETVMLLDNSPELETSVTDKILEEAGLSVALTFEESRAHLKNELSGEQGICVVEAVPVLDLEEKYEFVEVTENVSKPVTAHEVFPAGMVGKHEIIFRKGSSRIERHLEANGSMLDDITAALRELSASPDVILDKIYITGYSSPDGPLQNNEKLAYARALALKQFIRENIYLPDESFVLYNGGEDWAGLRELVDASDMQMRGRILDIIDHVPVWNGTTGRLGALMRLESGKHYMYMYENMFPRLRKGVYVKITYRKK